MIVLNTQGIVLRSVKFNDSDVMLTLFTRKYGKVSAIAKGAQRQKSRHLFTSQIFSYNNYTLRKQKNMFVVSQSDSIKSFYNISMDFESFAHASFIAKLVETNTAESQPNARLFELLARTLFLYSEQPEDRLLILDSFLLKFVDFMGYRPQVEKCTICGTENYKYGVFSVDEGGIVCEKCTLRDNFYIKLDKTTISLMQYILNNDIIVSSKAQVSKILLEELFYILKRYLVQYFENVQFKSLDLLKTTGI